MAFRVSTLAQPSVFLCPCCGATPKAFLTIPDEYVEECEGRRVDHPLDAWETLNLDAYLCPSCGATDRDRLQVLFLEKTIRAGMRVLEIAPSAPVSNWLNRQEDIQYRSADFLRDDVDDKIDICDMSCYSDQSFDVVICSHVLEHVFDDRRAMRETKRILHPGGVAVLLVPISLLIEDVTEDIECTDEDERWRRFGQGDHVRIYGRTGFEGRLTEVGFRVETFVPTELTTSGLSKTTRLYLGYAEGV